MRQLTISISHHLRWIQRWLNGGGGDRGVADQNVLFVVVITHLNSATGFRLLSMG